MFGEFHKKTNCHLKRKSLSKHSHLNSNRSCFKNLATTCVMNENYLGMITSWAFYLNVSSPLLLLYFLFLFSCPWLIFPFRYLWSLWEISLELTTFLLLLRHFRRPFSLGVNWAPWKPRGATGKEKKLLSFLNVPFEISI